MYTGPKSFARCRVIVASKCIMGLFWALSLFLIVSLRNRTVERRGRQNAWAWQTWRNYYLRVLSRIHSKLMFLTLLQKDLFKGMWSLAEAKQKQNYCHACHSRFAVVFPLPSCCVSSLMSTATATKTSLKNLRRDASNFIALNISSRSIRQMLAIISGVEFAKNVWFVQLQTNKFQGFFKDKLQFSRTNIYSIINRHSLTPLWTHHWLKHVMHVILFKHKSVFT